MADTFEHGEGIRLGEGVSLDMNYMANVLLIAMLKRDLIKERIIIKRRPRAKDELEGKRIIAESQLKACEGTDAQAVAEAEYEEILDNIDGEDYWIKDSQIRVEFIEEELKNVVTEVTQYELAKKNYE